MPSEVRHDADQGSGIGPIDRHSRFLSSHSTIIVPRSSSRLLLGESGEVSGDLATTKGPNRMFTRVGPFDWR